MMLTPPKKTTFRLALIAAILSLGLRVVGLDLPADASFWLMTAAFALLALGVVFTGL